MPVRFKKMRHSKEIETIPNLKRIRLGHPICSKRELAVCPAISA
jgi:hypothetical protein